MIIPGSEPTLTGTCSTICPAPLPLEILMLTTPTSPATASLGGVTVMFIVPDSPGDIMSPLFGMVTFHPCPALPKYGLAGEFPFCSINSSISPPVGGTSSEASVKSIRQPATAATSRVVLTL